MEYEYKIVKQKMINDSGPIEHQDEIQWPTGDVLIRVPKQPERLNPEDASNSVCDSLTSVETQRGRSEEVSPPRCL